MLIQVSGDIDRPRQVVFRFYADEHVQNHPRWDPDIDLWMDQDAPIRVGTIIRRRNRRWGTPIEGTMEVVEYEPDRSLAMVTREGAMEIHGRAVFDDSGEGGTRLTISADMPIDESMRDAVTGMIERSLQNIKQLVEAETAPTEVA
jgi:uncharacterized protein YndB with AHSA1/START domain